jgi:hypothetical protein
MSGGDWGAAAGNPTVAGDNLSFPFDRVASTLLEAVPDGLVASPAVLSEFLDPPPRGEWFCNLAWERAAVLLRYDAAITAEEYQDLIRRFSEIEAALVRWTELRQDMSNGYADTLSETMRSAGATAFTEIRTLARGRLTPLSAKPGVEAATKMGMKDFGEALWEYVQCMAFELEASREQIDVPAIRDLFQAGVPAAWEPALTPGNIDDGGVTAGGHRLPPPPPSPGSEPPTGDTSVTQPPDDPPPGTDDPGSTGDGGEPGKGERGK